MSEVRSQPEMTHLRKVEPTRNSRFCIKVSPNLSIFEDPVGGATRRVRFLRGGTAVSGGRGQHLRMDALYAAELLMPQFSRALEATWRLCPPASFPTAA